MVPSTSILIFAVICLLVHAQDGTDFSMCTSDDPYGCISSTEGKNLIQVAQVQHINHIKNSVKETQTAWTCSMESQARQLLTSKQAVNVLANGNRAPMFIRGVFHDSVDANNLLEKGQDGNWTSLAADKSGATGWVYGGVDGCMYSTLADDGPDSKHCEDGEGGNKPPCPGSQHNRNIKPAMDIAEEVCADLGFSQDVNCVVDMMVLGAIVAIEDAGGPAINMTWGRIKGDCGSMACNSKTCSDESKALDLAPKMFGLDELADYRTVWNELGFNAEEETALMGAHTFGKANVCVGGLNGVMRGHHCSDPARLIPPLNASNMAPTCELKAGQPSGCWKQGARSSKFKCASYPCTWTPPDLFPEYPIYGRYLDKKKDDLLNANYKMLNDDVIIGEGFADGAVWDQTPEVFDNEYFKLLQGEQLSQSETCCGPVGEYKYRPHKGIAEGRVCLEVGDEKKDDFCNGDQACLKSLTHRSTGAQLGELCSAKWCRYGDKKGRGHMKSPTLWHEANHSFVKKADKHGPFKRLIRLAGDWALLSPQTKPYVDAFANDQDQFFAAFKNAFNKVIHRGYDPTQLSPCQ